MKKIAKLLAVALVVTLAASLVACGGSAPASSAAPAPAAPAAPAPAAPAPAAPAAPAAPTEAPTEVQKVGVSMPTRSLQRWNQDGANLQAQLEAAGFEVDLQFGGENEIPVQISQIENMISGGCNYLIIAAIDSGSMSEVLATAKAQGVKVISYDRLIMDTDAVDYYATFDLIKVGELQGQYIKDTLDLDNASGPFNIEFTGGDPPDNNAGFFFQGALNILQPYLDNGKLVCLSGQTTFEQCATPGWSTETSQARMENLISQNGYGPNGTKLDAVMCSNDSTAQGVTNALVNAGYAAGEGFPIVTGQDCDIVSVKNMIAGTQAMSVFKDTRTLASEVVKMIVSLGAGQEPTLNTSYNNGAIDVPSYNCEPVFGSVDNYRELLIEGGYYTEADLA